ncbi:polyketide synthase dehydratase domain-containing protein [Streptomyces stramineus]
MGPARPRRARPGRRRGPAGLTAWPPAGAAEADLSGLYDKVATRGYEYGPVFQGLRRAWTGENEIFAEVALPEDQHADAALFTLHPALLDAALHPLLPGAVTEDRPALMPFSWSGVSVYAAGASVLRVKLSLTGTESAALTVADGVGAPVATVASLALRPLSTDALRDAGAAGRDGLLRVAWTALPLTEASTDPDNWAVLGDGNPCRARRPAASPTSPPWPRPWTPASRPRPWSWHRPPRGQHRRARRPGPRRRPADPGADPGVAGRRPPRRLPAGRRHRERGRRGHR